MLSNKMTFSLTSLVMLLAFGLVFTRLQWQDPVDTEPEPTLTRLMCPQPLVPSGSF